MISGSSDRFSFLGLQSHCRWWLQPWNWETLAPWKESYDKPRQRIKKQRHQFVDKGPYSQTMTFSVAMYTCESCTIKKAWAPKNWCFQTVVLEKTLESPLDCKEIIQSTLKDFNLEYSLEGLMLKLKLQYFGHLMETDNSLGKTLMMGKIGGKRRRRKKIR